MKGLVFVFAANLPALNLYDMLLSIFLFQHMLSPSMLSLAVLHTVVHSRPLLSSNAQHSAPIASISTFVLIVVPYVARNDWKKVGDFDSCCWQLPRLLDVYLQNSFPVRSFHKVNLLHTLIFFPECWHKLIKSEVGPETNIEVPVRLSLIFSGS
jgi:hypothetical protein